MGARWRPRADERDADALGRGGSGAEAEAKVKRAVKGLFVFIGAAAFAAAFYALTKPDGLPWGVAAAFGALGDRPLPLCVVAAGLLGALFNRYFGWKVGVAAATIWIFAPGVWNGAILGEPFAALAALGVVALFVLNAILLFVFRKAIAVHHSASEQGQSTLSSADIVGWRGWVNYLAGWVFLGAAAIFAIVSLWLHDYKLGEPASVYARGIVEDAGERIIVLNGVADEQVENEVKVEGEGEQWKVLSLTKGEEYREDVLKWVRTEWPGETNLAVAAQVSVSAFADEAIKVHPERFYVMNGDSTTREAWEKRWAAFEPYLKSSDRFVPVARRLFAREGNAVANRLQDTDAAAAWKLYGRIANEIDSDNISALVNMSEMLRKGLYTTTEKEKKDIKARIDAFLAKDRNRAHAREIVRMMGPVKEDPELEAKMREARQAQFEAMKASGQKLEFSPAYKRMKQGSDAMIDAFVAGDLEGAGAIARRILSDPQWAEWAPANAVMGVVCASKGEYAAAEKFFVTATTRTDVRPDIIMNAYADTLMHLGKLDEAEAILREGIARTGEKFWPFQYTLAEVLTKKATLLREAPEGKKDETQLAAIKKEVAGLVLSVMKDAPPEYKREIRAKQKSGEILR